MTNDALGLKDMSKSAIGVSLCSGGSAARLARSVPPGHVGISGLQRSRYPCDD